MKKKKILDTQFGFQKGKSTIDCIFTLHSIIAKTLDAGEKFYCISNEYHFLLVCPLYRDLRIKYFKPYYCRWPTLNKFDDLMCNTSKNVILNVAKYIYFAFQLRKEN